MTQSEHNIAHAATDDAAATIKRLGHLIADSMHGDGDAFADDPLIIDWDALQSQRLAQVSRVLVRPACVA